LQNRISIGTFYQHNLILKKILLSSKLYLSYCKYFSKIPLDCKQRPIIVITQALISNYCRGEISSGILFWPDTNNFLQKKYRLLEHLDI